MLSCPRFLKPKQHRAHRKQKGGSINGGTLKWMADRTGGYPHDLGNLHMKMSTTNTYQNGKMFEHVGLLRLSHILMLKLPRFDCSISMFAHT